MTEPDQYGDIFAHRGDSYAAAMASQPHARDAEFENLFLDVVLENVRIVADIPSGSGYLATWLPDGTVLDAYDPAVAFRDRGNGILPVDLDKPRLARTDYDLAICLASLHHVADKSAFFDALARHVRPGGQIVMADIHAASPMVGFLDGFVGLHNGTGHEGMYLDPERPFAFGEQHPRVERVVVDTRACPWRFDDRAAMSAFGGLLFGADTAGPRAIDEAIERHVGTRPAIGGGIEMLWELTYITATLN